MEIIRKITGTTGGESSVTDGLSRGAFIAAFQALLAWGAMETGWLDADDLVKLLPVTTLLGGIAWGVWDALDRRLRGRRQDAFDATMPPEDRMESGDDVTPGNGI